MLHLNNTNKHIIHLKESTCIDNELSYDIIQFVNAQVISKNSFFHFSDKEREAEPVFNYYNNQWWVNRFVGEISFTYGYFGSICATHFGQTAPMISLQTAPL